MAVYAKLVESASHPGQEISHFELSEVIVRITARGEKIEFDQFVVIGLEERNMTLAFPVDSDRIIVVHGKLFDCKFVMDAGTAAKVVVALIRKSMTEDAPLPETLEITEDMLE